MDIGDLGERLKNTVLIHQVFELVQGDDQRLLLAVSELVFSLVDAGYGDSDSCISLPVFTYALRFRQVPAVNEELVDYRLLAWVASYEALQQRKAIMVDGLAQHGAKHDACGILGSAQNAHGHAARLKRGRQPVAT